MLSWYPDMLPILQDQRVKALKIAIQCAKLLADTKVVQFYPS